MQNLTPYLPLLTSITSLCTALVVAVIGFRFSRSIEAGKVRAAYLNYALQKILDEYIKLDPSINLPEAKDGNWVTVIQAKFYECRSCIRRINPLIPSESLRNLRLIEIKFDDTVRRGYNSNLRGEKPEPVSAGEFASMLTDYINSSHEILRKQAESLRIRLEAGESRMVHKS